MYIKLLNSNDFWSTVERLVRGFLSSASSCWSLFVASITVELETFGQQNSSDKESLVFSWLSNDEWQFSCWSQTDLEWLPAAELTNTSAWHTSPSIHTVQLCLGLYSLLVSNASLPVRRPHHARWADTFVITLKVTALIGAGSVSTFIDVWG